MAKIRILPEHLANQIAAGEVVERPASVVKELLENSLDAGADRIEVEIEGSGTRLIRIADNGEGMDEDDVLMCFERHGTSKLTKDDTVFEVRSLGFRGEAIPSIASVSTMNIVSRRREDQLGTAAYSSFGSIKKVHETGTGAGTIIEVKNLFGNTPARKKFLRTSRTELSHIDDTLKSYALARPDVAFSLRVNGKQTIQFDQDLDLAQRLSRLLKYTGEFIVIDSGSPALEGIRVTGLLVPPESTQPVAGRLRLFVNNRVIKDRLLGHAVNEGLRSFMLKGRYPAGLIKVDLPPESVDVNVHPAKHEVRFKDNRSIHQIVSTTVREAMLRTQQPLREHIFSQALPTDTIRTQIQSPPPIPPSAEGNSAPPPAQQVNQGSIYELSQQDSSTLDLAEEQQHLEELTSADAATGFPIDSGTTAVQVENLVVVGSFQDLYIFCRNGDNLIVIDQHAAHERLLYEDFRKQYLQGRIASQNLLFPVTLELTVYQSQLVEANLEELENMGFSVRDFGATTWVLSGVPALAGSSSPQDLFLDILERFGSEAGTGGSGRLEGMLATMACKAAVKSGDALSDPEIKALLERMVRADLFSHCPHGRPVVKVLPPSEIKKWFQRT
ncbi:MAG: DNA mismatch repair endonuclease MutL [Desulfocapsaceae bacterium]